MNATRDPITILTLLQYFEPGYKAGGPITTIRNSIDHLTGPFHFRVVTSDRDLGDTGPYSVTLDQWITGAADTLYLSAGSNRQLFRTLENSEYDVLYLNSFFSVRYSIVPILWLRARKNFTRKVIVAPRGEFSKGALSIKSAKKTAYITMAKLLGLYNHVIWQASSEEEKKDILRTFGSKVSVIVASDLPSKRSSEQEIKTRNKQSGKLKLVFLSRISRMKNLHFALESLQGVRGEVSFHIYGPKEDEHYWNACQEIINRLPSNISVEYKGAVEHRDVQACLEQYELFYLPTLGEGFGHAIFEAMQSACPLLLSDRSPWSDIALNGAGADLPLDDIGAFTEQIQRFVDMEQQEYDECSRSALRYSQDYMKDSHVIQAHIALFTSEIMQRPERRGLSWRWRR